MAVSKVVYDGTTLIDLTSDTITADTLKKGYTAHGADGEEIIGTLEMVDYLSLDIKGDKTITSDSSVITIEDSDGQKLTKTFTNDFQTCTCVLTNSDGDILGETTKEFNEDSTVITTTNSIGQQLVKTFSNDMNSCESVLYDTDGTELARESVNYSS